MNILELTKEIETEAIRIRREVHKNPELSLKEYKTSDFLEKELKKIGIEVSREGLKTGVLGILRGKKPGKTIALRADIDALPIAEETGLEFASQNEGVMHACGHDIHTAVLFGCAKVLSNFKDEISGNIKFFFQPAEEKLGGAKNMIKAGALKDPDVDAILGVHTWPDLPAGTIGLKKGPFMASADEIKIKVKGKGGHAAHPDKCVDPIVIAGYILTKLQTVISRESSPVDPVVITLGTINGGTAPNIIPSEVEMTGTIRTVNYETHDKIFNKIDRIVKYTAKSMNGDAETEYKIGTPPLVCDNKFVDIMYKSVSDVLGASNIIELKEPSMGGEAFAFYLEKVPGALIRLGTANEDENSHLSLHNSKIIFDEKAITTGIAAMSQVALAYLSEK